ncbi:mediator of RNA polymerase II transcription subunit 12-like isoform X2 [Rhincodon typus]|uniref:mediator of RNA polymerase II transcription subunit 12-like isoform X2 n=1 Tax=Rhincodon typus TaxID=259920 RepID=UPI00202E672D|nr:mediator of RNA polymerase II transcription subunit 12-like isoform X2 [Rhincodon typus]
MAATCDFNATNIVIFSPMPGDSLTCEHNTNPSLEQGTTRDEKPIRKEKQKELIFPCTYEHPRHLQYATHFPIPQNISKRRFRVKMSQKIELAANAARPMCARIIGSDHRLGRNGPEHRVNGS